MTERSQQPRDDRTPDPLEVAEREGIAIEPAGAVPEDTDDVNEEGSR